MREAGRSACSGASPGKTKGSKTGRGRLAGPQSVLSPWPRTLRLGISLFQLAPGVVRGAWRDCAPRPGPAPCSPLSTKQRILMRPTQDHGPPRVQNPPLFPPHLEQNPNSSLWPVRPSGTNSSPLLWTQTLSSVVTELSSGQGWAGAEVFSEQGERQGGGSRWKG